MKISPLEVAPFIAAPLLLIMIMWVLVVTSGSGKR
jgi:hypothetical protein